LNTANENLIDMTFQNKPREFCISVAIIVLCFLIGLFPNLLFDKINPATAQLATLIHATTLIAGQ
jgi:NADH:ubiquinone oxidoreductase subunit 4 (subunit M)